MFDCDFEDALIIFVPLKHETWTSIYKFCKKIWGVERAAFYSRPRAALGLATPSHATQLFIERTGVPHDHVECAPCMGHTRQKKYPF